MIAALAVCLKVQPDWLLATPSVVLDYANKKLENCSKSGSIELNGSAGWQID
jgi:hypothetical protein